MSARWALSATVFGAAIVVASCTMDFGRFQVFPDSSTGGGGQGGAGGAVGSGGTTSSSGTGGSGGTTSSSGTGGSGGTTSSSGTGGSGGTTSSSGTGGGGGGSTVSISSQVNQSGDDAEEATTDGAMYLDSTDLEIGDDFSYWGAQTLGLRFVNVAIPNGATIVSAYVEFEVDETGSSATAVQITGEAADDPGSFTTTNWDITARTATSAAVSWNPGPWNNPNASEQTPDLSSVVQEIVDRGGWSSNNAMVFVIAGTGERTATAFDGGASGAPQLFVEYAQP